MILPLSDKLSAEGLEGAFEKLSKFGLTSYEIKVYRTLLTNGPLTAMGVVKLSGVPQPRIYDVFNNMISKGLVEASPGKKKVYKALPVTTVLDRRIEELTLDIEKISKGLEENSVRTGDDGEPPIWLIEAENNIRQKVKETVSGAKYELLMCVGPLWWKYAKKHIQDAIERGVTVALVLSPEIDQDEVGSKFSDAFVRRRKYASSQVIISDRVTGILDTESVFNSRKASVFIQENEMIHILNYYFYHTLWDPSIEIVNPERKKKFSFTTNWLMCEISDSMIRAGKKLSINVTGMADGKETELSGSVIKVENEEGLRHSLILSSKGRNYSIGGRSAKVEDIAMKMAVLHVL
jgi:sugar-specific transcriptional regulator TrmB